MNATMTALIAFVTFLHARLAIALLLFAVLLGVWSMITLGTGRRVSGGLRSSFLLMIGLTAVQGFFGLLALATGHHSRNPVHFVYGLFAIAFLPGLYFFAARGSRAREAMLLAIASWVVAIAYGRGIITG
jgi:hypothetical protein